MSETITVYVTKHALSQGIKKIEASEVSDSPGMVRSSGVWGYYHGNDWHRTMDAAVKRAEEMRVAKIKSLEKQIAKLRALKFGGA